ncbi:Pth11-like integral membrane protein [Rutstroemia sp. NJR-2017a WRK4]|nr:Pth11-like integral membrane protein [Rutstroemia sp. NJR-2017a WRK4]
MVLIIPLESLNWLYASDVNFANASFFWITLYCVKGSFLALYWELFSVSSGFKKAWYIVATFTGLTFLMTFASIFWICGSPKDIHNLDACNSNPEPLISNLTIIWCVLHVVGDLLSKILVLEII